MTICKGPYLLFWTSCPYFRVRDKMKKILIMAALLSVAGCTSSNGLGNCIGAFDTGEDTLVYETSSRNVGISVISFLFPPAGIVTSAVVIATEAKCPVRKK